MAAVTERRVLLVGVRGHGGEEVYSSTLRDRPPTGVRVEATLDFHRGCAWARAWPLTEIGLNRLVYPLLGFDLGFRVLSVGGEPDLVHVHSHPTILLRRRGRPVVFSAGSSHYHYLRDYEGWSESRIEERYARARRLYAPFGVTDPLLNPDAVTLAYTFSEDARRIYCRFGVPEQKIRVLRPGIDVPPERSPRRGPEVTFLFLGRNPRRKGGDAVLRAFGELVGTRPGVRLIFVSDELPGIRQPGVEFRSRVPDKELARTYDEADVFVNPTRAEGYGLTNAEAQGHSLAVISSRIGAISEVVADGETGLLVPPDDPGELLRAMETLATDHSLRLDMAMAARQRFLRLFTRHQFERALAAIYEEAIAVVGN